MLTFQSDTKLFGCFFLSHWFCLIFLLQAFKLFDVDRDGLVTTTELRSLIKKVSHLTCQISGKPLILSCEVDGCGYFFRSGELCQRVRLLAWYARFLFVDSIFTQKKACHHHRLLWLTITAHVKFRRGSFYLLTLVIPIIENTEKLFL